jgi:hypothetical protein
MPCVSATLKMMDYVSTIVAPGGRTGDPALPLVTVDLDGVLAVPLFGWNLTAHRPAMPDGAPPRGRMLKGWLWPAETVRYVGRGVMPGARAFLHACAPWYRLVLLSARGRPSLAWTRRWLRRAGLLPYLDGIALRADPHQPSYAFKAAAVAALDAAYHVDDDGRTAVYVHRHTGRPVLLIDWPRNAGACPPGIDRVPDLAAAAAFLTTAARRDGG